MDCILRFSQVHESFRIPEIQALAVLENIQVKILDYRQDSPFCLINVPSADAARALVRRSILCQSIHEFWAHAPSGLLSDLHHDVRQRATPLCEPYTESSFKFALDTFHHTRPHPERLAIFNSFSYLPLKGAIILENPDETFTVFEDWPFRPPGTPVGPHPRRILLGRLLAHGARDLLHVYDLKKRGYISTTSMDSELALVTANLALARPGALVYDPFVGTGSFPVAAAHFGALALGSDIDGRCIRGAGGPRSVRGNFEQYGLLDRWGDFFVADLTNTPLARRRWLDAIVCDPPYGVREGLRVLGARKPERAGVLAVASSTDRFWKSSQFIPPKKPYSFLAMLDDILEFAAQMLVDQGRISFWMPTANDEDQELAVPTHPCLEIVAVCVQPFNKWSRRLITYSRIPDDQVDPETVAAYQRTQHAGKTADELNPFRESYFKRFKKDTPEGEADGGQNGQDQARSECS
ncbi:hypothetical protein ACRALDRAFT_1070498 [Sodiomyces alcalophilus JCM 7366]|uniref:uncharacterized protein n=1 Tax=Sodiomyces alcalophilus JCM 7366 TaxID=591952 RepID=UPI0039B509B9